MATLLPDGGKASIIERLTEQADEMSETNLVQHMCELVDLDDFWSPRWRSSHRKHEGQFEPVPFFLSQQMSLDETVALRSLQWWIPRARFTFKHSLKVVGSFRVSRQAIAIYIQRSVSLYLAGYLHGTIHGKVTNTWWYSHKPGFLTDEEYCCIKSCDRYTVRTSGAV